MQNQHKLETWLNTAARPHREIENSQCVHAMLLELTSNVFIVINKWLFIEITGK